MCCQQAAPDPEWDLVTQGREAAGSSLQLWPMPQKHHYIILVTALSALRYYSVSITVNICKNVLEQLFSKPLLTKCNTSSSCSSAELRALSS